jgi:hypothetical protein
LRHEERATRTKPTTGERENTSAAFRADAQMRRPMHLCRETYQAAVREQRTYFFFAGFFAFAGFLGAAFFDWHPHVLHICLPPTINTPPRIPKARKIIAHQEALVKQQFQYFRSAGRLTKRPTAQGPQSHPRSRQRKEGQGFNGPFLFSHQPAALTGPFPPST